MASSLGGDSAAISLVVFCEAVGDVARLARTDLTASSRVGKAGSLGSGSSGASGSMCSHTPSARALSSSSRYHSHQLLQPLRTTATAVGDLRKESKPHMGMIVALQGGSGMGKILEIFRLHEFEARRLPANNGAESANCGRPTLLWEKATPTTELGH